MTTAFHYYHQWEQQQMKITEQEQESADKFLSYLIEDDYDLEDDCVAWFIDHYNDNPQDLCNYQTSDFVNLDMCYTKDLINFYKDNETFVLEWVDKACDAYGYTSRLQLLEGQTIEDPDDFATGLVNAAMTYLGNELYTIVENS